MKTVTAVPKSKVVDPVPPTVGNACRVKMGNATYSGEVVAAGKQVLHDHALHIFTCTCPNANILTGTCTKTCTCVYVRSPQVCK